MTITRKKAWANVVAEIVAARDMGYTDPHEMPKSVYKAAQAYTEAIVKDAWNTLGAYMYEDEQ